MARFREIMKLGSVVVLLSMLTLPITALAAPGDVTTTGSLTITPTIECAGVVVSYTGDANQNNSAVLQYRQSGTSQWLPAPPMYADRSNKQYRGSIFWLTTNTSYQVRVTFSDADVISGSNPITGTVTTHNDNPAIGTNYYYVSPSGSDSNSGTSINQPFETIQKAANVATAGSTVLVRAGTYSEMVTISTSGTSGGYITFMPYNSETVIIDGGASAAWGFVVNEANYIRIRGFRIQNTRGTSEDAGGITFDDASYGIAEYNTISNVGLGGDGAGAGAIRLNYTANTLVQYNTLTQTVATGEIAGIAMRYAGVGNVLRYNVIYSPSTYWWDGIGNYPEDYDFFDYNRDLDIYGNTISGCNDDGIQTDGSGINLRVWSNTITPSFLCGLSMCGIKTGPAYWFRNVVVIGAGANAAIKAGDEGNRSGPKYIYHNTFYAASNGNDGIQDTDWDMGNFIFKNNIVYASRYVYEMGSATVSGPCDMDYNNIFTTDDDRFTKWTGSVTYYTFESHKSNTGMDAHSISVADNKFVNAGAYEFNLQSSSPGIDKGVALTGFNDTNSPWPYSGAAPDIGAYEYGSGGPTNSPPVLNTIGNKSVNTGQTLQFTVSAIDPNGDTLTYSASNLPTGATFTPSTRTFSWTPTAGQAGSYTNVHFEVSDGSLTDYENITITVLGGDNEPPVLNAIGNKSVDEDTLLQFTISATDPDNDPLTYSASNLPTGATFNTTTRIFSWTPTAGQAGSYTNVHFEVSDGTLTDYENITITVLSGGENQPPVLNTIGNKSVTAGQTLQFTVSATDPNGDTLTYSASNLPTGTTFTPSTRTFSWIPTSGQVGSYPNVRFTVSDGTLTDYENITITVMAGEEPSPALMRVNAGGNVYTDTQGSTWETDQAYVSGSWGFYGPDNTVDRGTGHAIIGTVDDRIYQTERYGLSGYRFDLENGTYDVVLHFAETYLTGSGQRVFDVSIEGQLVLDNLDIYSEAGYSAALEELFNGIVVQDGQLNIEFSSSIDEPEINGIEIIVTSGSNSAPTLSLIDDKSVAEGTLLQFVIYATDPNGDSLTYSASNLPDGAVFNTQTRTFSWTPLASQVGIYPNVRFTVSDGSLTDYEDITITVVEFYEDWDANSDGATNILDVIVVGQHWGETGLAGWIRADVNKDGIINILDIITIGQNWTG